MSCTKRRSTADTLAVLNNSELDIIHSSQQEILKQFDWNNDFNHLQGRLPNYKTAMMIIWQIFEEPRSSSTAKVITMISIFFMLASILSFILQTLSMFRITDIDFITVYINNTTTVRIPTLSRQLVHSLFDVVEWICLLIFYSYVSIYMYLFR